MPTYHIVTLGCKVNQYESQQVASLLRCRGFTRSADAAEADLRIINTCSVTLAAASKSRQAVRQTTRQGDRREPGRNNSPGSWIGRHGPEYLPMPPRNSLFQEAASHPGRVPNPHAAAWPVPRTIVIGCWATSDSPQVASLAGVDAVIGHHNDVAAELARLLTIWQSTDAGATAPSPMPALMATAAAGTASLPLLADHQGSNQRALLKIQDGCDAHCTYCIVPSIRPILWSKPPADVLDEARRLVDAGHRELVLTGIFLGAYGQKTAMRRRQSHPASTHLGQLVMALCTQVPGLVRLRLSSLEPGDLDRRLLDILASHRQVVPHFHLPLQSGCDRVLRRMNRQYTSSDYRVMVDNLRQAFDRPALTTDIIVGFPGETDQAFADTLALVDHARFVHIHAFPFSARPGTAAARWTGDCPPASQVDQRLDALRQRGGQASLEFRQGFVGQTVNVMVERPNSSQRSEAALAGHQHGRCERYFSVHFPATKSLLGQCLPVRITQVTDDHTLGVAMTNAQ